MDDDTKRESPSLVRAAEKNDFNEAAAAISSRDDAGLERNWFGQNALQVAILNAHEDMALFILNNVSIQTMAKDYLDRDSLDIALLIGSEKLCECIESKWTEEWRKGSSEEIGLSPI